MAGWETGREKQFALFTVICGRQEGEEGGGSLQFSCSAMWLFQGFPETQFQPLMKTAETSVTQHSPHHWMIVIMISRDGNNWFPQTDRSVPALLWDSCAVAVCSGTDLCDFPACRFKAVLERWVPNLSFCLAYISVANCIKSDSCKWPVCKIDHLVAVKTTT